MTDLAPVAVSERTERLGVTAAYLAQGLSYATVVTSLPALKDRYSIDDDTVSLITLTVVLGAAGGSVLADRIAVKRGSKAGLIMGLGMQAVALLLVATPLPFPAFWAMFAIYGIGLGMVDAAAAMQGVIVQRRLGKSVMGSFFAASTAAGIVGALVMSGSASTSLGASIGMIVAGVFAAFVAGAGTRIFDPTMERAAREGTGPAPRIPRAGLWIFGFVVFAAFTADSTISTWSTVYLEDTLNASASVAPLGYAVYAAFTLITRLTSDVVIRRFGRAPLALGTAVIAVVGIGVAGLLPVPVAAVVGFALAGTGVGALVPLAFSAAGDLDPRRGDEIVARVNLFTYGGSLIGAVLPGLLSDSIGLNASFLIAAVLLAPVLLTVRHFRTSTAAEYPEAEALDVEK